LWRSVGDFRSLASRAFVSFWIMGLCFSDRFVRWCPDMTATLHIFTVILADKVGNHSFLLFKKLIQYTLLIWWGIISKRLYFNILNSLRRQIFSNRIGISFHTWSWADRLLLREVIIKCDMLSSLQSSCFRWQTRMLVLRIVRLLVSWY